MLLYQRAHFNSNPAKYRQTDPNSVSKMIPGVNLFGIRYALDIYGDNSWSYSVYDNPRMIYDTLWVFNIAIENHPFIDGLPIKNGGSFHGKLLVITRW